MLVRVTNIIIGNLVGDQLCCSTQNLEQKITGFVFTGKITKQERTRPILSCHIAYSSHSALSKAFELKRSGKKSKYQLLSIILVSLYLTCKLTDHNILLEPTVFVQQGPR